MGGQHEAHSIREATISSTNTDSITINGQPFSVEVRGKVFDNVSSDGRSRKLPEETADWLNKESEFPFERARRVSPYTTLRSDRQFGHPISPAAL
jgi:hypothetical protein